MKNTFPLRVVNPESLDLLSKKVDGIQKIRGNKEQVIRFVSSLHNANKDSLVFCSATDSEKIKSAIRDTSASMIVVSRDIGAYLDKTLIITKISSTEARRRSASYSCDFHRAVVALFLM